ncbi:hypothetical protein PIB30_034327 [Stylosanthes scabra]|uniref:Uncharacterized protein n=1 Tax=Stylosanthes scabra TaxID=79078 RepID=A0ABU6TEL2_9FABA|nr:hypothetical protein [Stylosanthes scabra]
MDMARQKLRDDSSWTNNFHSASNSVEKLLSPLRIRSKERPPFDKRKVSHVEQIVKKNENKRKKNDVSKCHTEVLNKAKQVLRGKEPTYSKYKSNEDQ